MNMIPKKWMTVIGTLLLVFLLGTGFYVMATSYGSESDPLVSLSYINDVLTPAIEKQMDSIIADKTADFEKKLAEKVDSYLKNSGELVSSAEKNYQTLLDDSEFIDKLAAAVAAKMGGASSAAAATFTQVTIPKGKTMYLTLGCEVVLRLGTGTCVASGSPGLIDMTTGSVLAGGSKLTANHLYMVSVNTDGTTRRGISAASGDVTVMVLGSYTVS